jgi:acetolactate synthase-1/2/3 large subunit
MLAHDGPVFVDCRVARHANCFPMIPSGAAHTEMLLGPGDVEGSIDKAAEALV